MKLSGKKILATAATLNAALLGCLMTLGVHSSSRGLLAADSDGAERLNRALHDVRETQTVLRRELSAISQDLARSESQRDTVQIQRELERRDRQLKDLMSEERLLKRLLAEKKTDLAFFRQRSHEISQQLSEIETNLEVARKQGKEKFLPAFHQAELEATRSRIEERRSRLLDEKRVLDRVSTANFKYPASPNASDSSVENRYPAQNRGPSVENDRMF